MVVAVRTKCSVWSGVWWESFLHLFVTVPAAPGKVVLCFDRGMNLSSQLERTEGKGNSLNPTGGKYNSIGLLNSSMTVTAVREMALASWELTLCHL